jgi:hypothetical protein
LDVLFFLRLLASFRGGKLFGLGSKVFELVPGLIKLHLQACAALTLADVKPQKKEANGDDGKNNNWAFHFDPLRQIYPSIFAFGVVQFQLIAGFRGEERLFPVSSKVSP